jgi:hypothetical protein
LPSPALAKDATPRNCVLVSGLFISVPSRSQRKSLSIANVSNDTISKALVAASIAADNILSPDPNDQERRNLWTPKYVDTIAKSKLGHIALLVYTKDVASIIGVLYQAPVPFKLSVDEEIEYTRSIRTYSPVSKTEKWASTGLVSLAEVRPAL